MKSKCEYQHVNTHNILHTQLGNYAHLRMAVLCSEDQGGVTLGGLLLEIRSRHEQFQGDLIKMV